MKCLIRIITKPNIWLAVLLMAAFTLPAGNRAQAAGSAKQSNDFIIHADSISGDMLPPTLVIEDGKAYLRFQYKSATIHGLTMTKVLQTGNGSMTVKIQAPSAKAVNMKVDVSAFTFGGACLNLGKTPPQAGLKNVTLAVHKQTAGAMDLSNAKIASLSGNQGLKRPSVPGLLSGLAGTTGNTLQQAVNKLMNGHVPLLQCSAGSNNENQSSGANNVADAVSKTSSTVGNTIGKVPSTVGDTGKTVKKLTGGTKKKVTSVVKKTTKTVGQVGKDAGGILSDAGSGKVGKLPGDVQKTVCDSIKQLGQLTKKLTTVQQQENALMTGSQKNEQRLSNLVSGLKQTKQKIDLLKSEKLTLSRLKLLKSETEQLKKQAGNVHLVKEAIKNSHYTDRFDQVVQEVNDLKGQLEQINTGNLCTKDHYNKLQKEVSTASDKENKMKSVLSQVQSKSNTAGNLVHSMYKEIGKIIQDAKNTLGGGLLGGINDILNGLIGNIQGLLKDIKNETG